MKRFCGLVIISEGELAEMWAELRAESRGGLDAWLKRVERAGPMTKEQILAGLENGEADKAVKSLLALARGIREATTLELANLATTPETAALLRGGLRFEAQFTQMVAACWAELERLRKGKGKTE